MENWKKIEGFEMYEISDKGNIKSNYFGKSKILKHKYDKNGYCQINMYKEKKMYMKKIHRLVIQHFSIDTPKDTVNHKNGIKTDNRIENLEWATWSENNKHAYDKGLKIQKAEYLKKRVLIYTDDFSKEYLSLEDASKELNLDPNCLSKVCRGKHKTHKKYKAKFI